MQARFSLDIVTLCSGLVCGGFAVLCRAVVLYLGVVVLCCCAVVLLRCCDAVMLGLVVCLGVLVLCGFVMSVDVGRNILSPAGCPMLLLGSTSPAILLYEHTGWQNLAAFRREQKWQ